MPKCPECGTSMIPRAPFYTCEICGLSVKKTETQQLDDIREKERIGFIENDTELQT